MIRSTTLLPVFILSVLFAVWCSNAVQAVGFDPLSIEALTARADLVLQGQVLAKSCQADSAGRIYTRVELQVTDVWKGTPPSSPLTIVHGGGVLDGRRSVVSGQVAYEIGEEVVVFLIRNTRGQAVTVGLCQGKFHLWKAQGTRYAVSPFHGVPERPMPATALQDEERAAPAPLLVEELKRRVQLQP